MISQQSINLIVDKSRLLNIESIVCCEEKRCRVNQSGYAQINVKLERKTEEEMEKDGTEGYEDNAG